MAAGSRDCKIRQSVDKSLLVGQCKTLHELALDLNEADDDNDSSKRSVGQVDPSDLGMQGVYIMMS